MQARVVFSLLQMHISSCIFLDYNMKDIYKCAIIYVNYQCGIRSYGLLYLMTNNLYFTLGFVTFRYIICGFIHRACQTTLLAYYFIFITLFFIFTFLLHSIWRQQFLNWHMKNKPQQTLIRSLRRRTEETQISLVRIYSRLIKINK